MVSDEFYSENSDCSDDETQLDNNFVIDYVSDNESVHFYCSIDNEPKFHNRTKTYEEAMNEELEPCYGDYEIIEDVEFHYFSDYKKKAASFKETLCFHSDSESNLLFSAVIYRIYYLKANEKPNFLSAIKKIDQGKFVKLKQIEKEIMLDYPFFGFFKRCMKLNEVLAEEFGYVLRFYEQRNKFRYQLKQNLKEKNKMKSELSACVIQKFNGYDLLRGTLSQDENKNILLLDIVYEPTKNINEPIYCYFAPKIHLAFHTVYEKNRDGKKVSVSSSNAKQCPYCEKIFLKPEKKKKEEHILFCSGQAGFNYSFNNGKIINYQDNFSKIGDLPFSIYYDFETTTRSAVFHDAKMYVVSYCIIAAFHPDLKLPHIFIYWSYDQTKEELESLEHFSDVIGLDFFKFNENYNLKTFRQLQDATLSVLNKTRKTALTEMFNIELKFTCDCLRNWFEKNIKLDELDENTIHEYRQNNIPENCCICDFPISSRAKNVWFDHICKAEHLFLENVYDSKDLFRMGILDYSVFNDRDNTEIEEIVKKTEKIKTNKNDKSEKCTKKKVLGYLYQHSIPFLSNDKTDMTFPMSEKFLINLYHIHINKPVIHHSHVTKKIIGFAHEYCNSQVR